MLVALLFIPGSPVGTNSKIAHSRHDDMRDGTHHGANPTPAAIDTAAAETSSLCKITNQPQLLSICAVIAGMLLAPTRRVHLCVWLPQLLLCCGGMFLQLARMGKDQRYAPFLAHTHWCPFYGLATGTSTGGVAPRRRRGAGAGVCLRVSVGVWVGVGGVPGG